MRRRHLPTTWLLTDPRMGERVWNALERLPRGSGVVLRKADAAVAARVRVVARRRGLMLVVAGAKQGARHDGSRPRPGATTASAHDRRELVAARRAGVKLVFVSPVFATRSHPGVRGLEPVRFGLLVRGAGVPVAALGGMTAARFGRMKAFGATAWGAIDAWAEPRLS